MGTISRALGSLYLCLMDIEQNGPVQNQKLDPGMKEAKWLRQAADRWERRGNPVTAVMFRNAAVRLENERKEQ